MVKSLVCKSISDMGNWTFIEFDSPDGFSFRITQPSSEPLHYQIRTEYMVEIAPVIKTALRLTR